MPSIQEKKDELTAELKQLVDKHNEANEIVVSCKQRIVEVQGGLAALNSLSEEAV